MKRIQIKGGYLQQRFGLVNSIISIFDMCFIEKIYYQDMTAFKK